MSRYHVFGHNEDYAECCEGDYSDWDAINDAGIHCSHAYVQRPIRSYGSNLPDNCQGVVFPGDEGGIYCDFYDDHCSDHAEGCPMGCGFWNRHVSDGDPYDTSWMLPRHSEVKNSAHS